MNIVALHDTDPRERRVALTPAVVEKLHRLGPTVHVAEGFGRGIHVSDDAYSEAGATVHADLSEVLAEADLVLGLNKPSLDVVEALRPGTVTASLLDPFRSPDLVRALAANDISAIAMELIPRSTYAQKMDALSSQASLAGYAAVIAAALEIGKVLPMMTTPAGTIPPARVFVIGVGVAGLHGETPRGQGGGVRHPPRRGRAGAVARREIRADRRGGDGADGAGIRETPHRSAAGEPAEANGALLRE
jgi:NAD(P) transhydrogenase subunit alpha